MYYKFPDTIRQQLVHYNKLPRIFEKNHNIDKTNLPRQLLSLYQDFNELCKSNDSSLILVKDYSKNIPIIYSLIEKMYSASLKFQYIDTTLYMKYLYKSITEKDETVRKNINNIIYTLYNEALEADFVFWDFFNINGENYFTKKIFEIVKIRYNDCLPNMFFIDKKLENFCECLTVDFRDLMSIKKIYNLTNVQDKIIIE